MLFSAIVKNPEKFDCLKSSGVLQLEELSVTPFHVVTLIVFLCAIFHILSVHKIHRWARLLELRRNRKKIRNGGRDLWIQMCYFLSEVELVFGIWAVPLLIVMSSFYNFRTALEYINTRDYTEALFVVVIMSLASTRPIIHLAETMLHRIANRLGGSLSAWWFTLLTLGPILGSLITEAAAMALSALLLSRQFYEVRPSSKLAYATLGLLFVNISVGGVMTSFASPAVLILSHAWHWNTMDMFLNFGWKAVLGILIANGVYWFYFRKEFYKLELRLRLAPITRDEETRLEVPTWVTLVHIAFISLIVGASHYPAIFIATFLFFLGFHHATRHYQYSLKMARPMLVGFFLAGLVIHGGVQGWWVVSILQDLTPHFVMGAAIFLTAFNDNTAISYLSTLVPGWGDVFKYAIFTGVIAGGGLTVIGNAPNPAGFQILRRHFEDGISPIKLFQAAAIPTLILYLIFYLFGPLARLGFDRIFRL